MIEILEVVMIVVLCIAVIILNIKEIGLNKQLEKIEQNLYKTKSKLVAKIDKDIRSLTIDTDRIQTSMNKLMFEKNNPPVFKKGTQFKEGILLIDVKISYGASSVNAWLNGELEYGYEVFDSNTNQIKILSEKSIKALTPKTKK